MHRRTGIFLPVGGGGGAVNHLPKKSYKLPKVYETVERKRGSYDALTMAYVYFLIYGSTYELKTLKNLKEIAVSSISTAEDINDAVHVIADNRIGICPFNVNKSNVSDTLLPHGAAAVSFQSAQRTE